MKRITLFFIIYILLSYQQGICNDFACCNSGEILQYKMKLFNMPAGKMVFHVVQEFNTTASPIIKVKVKAKTNTIFNPLFHIDNEYEAQFFKKTQLPLSLIKNIDQKNIKHSISIIYDQNKNQASISDSMKWVIPDSCYSFFSMFYHLRYNEYKKNDTLNFYIDAESIISRGMATITDSTMIHSSLGTLYAYKIDISFLPLNNSKRQWKTDLLTNRLASPHSYMTMWLSCDKYRLPLRVDFNQKQYKVSLELLNYKQPELSVQ